MSTVWGRRALECCLDIYRLHTEDEAVRTSSAMYSAWAHGKRVYDFNETPPPAPTQLRRAVPADIVHGAVVYVCSNDGSKRIVVETVHNLSVSAEAYVTDSSGGEYMLCDVYVE